MRKTKMVSLILFSVLISLISLFVNYFRCQERQQWFNTSVVAAYIGDTKNVNVMPYRKRHFLE